MSKKSTSTTIKIEIKNIKFKTRIIALLIDLALILAISVIFMIPAIISLVNLILYQTTLNVVSLFISCLISGALVISFTVFYFVCIPIFWDGQTVGKKLMNIKIIDITTNRVPNAKIMFLREGTRIITFVLTFGLSIIASIIAMKLTKNNVTFHETLSKTKVVESSFNSDSSLDINKN